jgi:hypothetical protein
MRAVKITPHLNHGKGSQYGTGCPKKRLPQLAKTTQQMAKPNGVYHRWQDLTDGKKDPTDGKT